MRKLLRSGVRWLSVGWFWPLALLALPNCSLERGGLLGTHFFPGPTPASSAIMCDIEQFQGRHCATPLEVLTGVPLARAAIALTTGQTSSIGLDYSPAALSLCGGQPQAVTFDGAFPEGSVLCLNCGAQIPSVFTDANAACVAKCQDVIDTNGPPAPSNSLVYCQANAHVSTNFAANSCYANACTTGGTPTDFVDPRRTPEPVDWDLADQIGTSAVGNSLRRTAPTTGSNTSDFNAGAASSQLITRGDAWVEFEAGETNLSHVLGLRPSCSDITICPDGDASLADIGFAISLNNDGRFYVIENGSLVAGPDVNSSFGTYSVGQRFRVRVTDKFDGSSTVTYTRVNGACTVGAPCPDTMFYTHTGAGPLYPVRVDTSFREQGARLVNVNIVRIQ